MINKIKKIFCEESKILNYKQCSIISGVVAYILIFNGSIIIFNNTIYGFIYLIYGFLILLPLSYYQNKMSKLYETN